MGTTVGLRLRLEFGLCPRTPLRREFTQQLAGQPLALAQAVLVDDALAVHPDAVHADRVGREARLACRQIEHAAVGAAVYGVRIEQQQVGVVPDLEHAALADAEHARRMTREPPRRLGERKHAALARPAAEEMQAEARIVEES